MKKILLLSLSLAFITIGIHAQSIYSKIDEDFEYKYCLDYKDVLAQLRLDGYTIVTQSYGTLKQAESAYKLYSFLPYRDYIIVGISNDYNVTDVDLHVYDKHGYVYEKDDGPDDVAVVHIYTYSTQQMKVMIKNAKTDTPDDKSTCRFVIAYK